MRLSSFLIALLLCFSLPSFAGDEFTIGYLELKNDERYKKKKLFARFLGQALGRPFAGAEVALKEVKFHGAEIGISFKLVKQTLESAEEISKEIDRLYQQGLRFILLDLPAQQIIELNRQQTHKDIILFNISAYEDVLRGEQCHSTLYHTLPSHAMLADALAQYLVSKKWRKVLELEGPLDSDKLLSASFEAAAKRYGLKITDKRSFLLSNDPRERNKNNIALLTRGNHDVIYIADTQGEFSRGAPYKTIKPNLIIGSEGINPSTWHWSWDRYGAPQLEKRFEKKAKRPMSSPDWAAWMAIKTIATAVQSTKSTEFSVLTTFLKSENSLFDTFKGTAASFRPWNNQLRQPILLSTHNWVIDRAPIKGFLHQKNNLDTLGFDEKKSLCKF